MVDRDTEKLVALVQAGELAMALWRAEEAATNARAAYHDRIERFERKHGNGERIKLDPREPKSAAILEYTRERYKAAKAAKGRAYRAKQKLLKMCVKVARLSAHSGEHQVGGDHE